MSDSHKTIWRSAARFFSGTLLSRLTGMLRDIAMAYAFGTQSAVAALMVAFRLAHLLRRLLGEGAMQTALIPHFEELRKVDPKQAGRFFCDLSLSLSLCLVPLIVIIVTVLGSLLALQVLTPGNAEIAWLTVLMMPSLLFICLFGLNASLLQCEKSYFVPSVAPVVFNLVWIGGVIYSYPLPISAAMNSLSLFIIVACLAQWVFTLPQTITYLKKYGLTRLWESFKCFSDDVRALAKPLSLAIVGVAASQINNALDAIFARWASEEGPALLWYAIRLQQLPLALFGIAISGALLPPLARSFKNQQLAQFRHFLIFALQRSLLLMLPMTMLLLIMGRSCVTLIYGHGDFGQTSIVGTTQALWGYTIGLVPMALVLVFAPVFYAQGNYRTPSLAATASMFLNVALNAVLVAGFHLGAASVALATSVSAWFNLAWLAYALQLDSPLEKGWWVPFVKNDVPKIVLATALATGVLVAQEIIVWEDMSFASSLMTQIAHLSLGGMTFLGVYALCCRWLKAWSPAKTKETLGI